MLVIPRGRQDWVCNEARGIIILFYLRFCRGSRQLCYFSVQSPPLLCNGRGERCALHKAWHWQNKRKHTRSTLVLEQHALLRSTSNVNLLWYLWSAAVWCLIRIAIHISKGKENPKTLCFFFLMVWFHFTLLNCRSILLHCSGKFLF